MTRILILGIGNVLWADEGFGVRCVEALADRWRLPARVRLLDGGTQGLYLLPFLEEADALIVFDAVDYGLAPGTLKVVEGDDVPAFLGARKMSLHQTGFQDVIATATLMGYCPARLVLIGCQPVELEDYGGGLRPAVAARIGEALEIALARLADWGVAARPGRSAAPDLADPAIRRAAYEAGRPREDEACRTGDARFFPGGGLMCLGVPMRLLSVEGIAGLASDGERTERIDLSLVGDVVPGAWLLCFLGTAREVLSADEAAGIAAALAGLRRLMAGEDLGPAFADLDDREPRLPPHLEAARQAGRTHG